MPSLQRLDGQVAWITGGGGRVGRALSLALGARGVRILVTGLRERRLGETVGEVVYGGGVARHLVADVREASALDAAAEKAVGLWGRLDLVIAAALVPAAGAGAAAARDVNLLGAARTFDAAAARASGALQPVAFQTPGGLDLEPLRAGHPRVQLVSFGDDEDAAVRAVLEVVLPPR